MPERTCPECGFPLRGDSHGYLRTGRFKVGKHGLENELIDCPSCSGDVLRRRKFERLRALMVEACIPPLYAEWSFATFPIDADKEQTVRDVASFARGDLGEALLQVYLHGPLGTGKTGLALAALRAHLATGEPGLYWTVPNLLQRIRSTYDRDASDTERSLMQQLVDVPFLVLDDLGAEKPSSWHQEKLFQLVNERLNHKKRTIYTSNVSIDDVKSIVGQRTADRIDYRCLPVFLGGKNLRRAEGQR